MEIEKTPAFSDTLAAIKDALPSPAQVDVLGLANVDPSQVRYITAPTAAPGFAARGLASMKTAATVAKGVAITWWLPLTLTLAACAAGAYFFIFKKKRRRTRRRR